jgi:hypothetical protein
LSAATAAAAAAKQSIHATELLLLLLLLLVFPSKSKGLEKNRSEEGGFKPNFRKDAAIISLR